MAASRNCLVFGWLAVLTVAWGWVAAGRLVANAQSDGNVEEKVASFEQLNVQRINVLEPDGKPRVIISNRELFPGLYWGGKEYKHHNRDTGGLLFFNRLGDEVGGLTFDAERSGEHWEASSGLAFDQYQQDQTVGIVYNEQDGKRTAGFKVWDRPNASMLPAVEFSNRAAEAKTDAEREQIRADMMSLAKSWGPQGERLFAGKVLDDAIVRLADKQGRPRLVLKVDGAGEPSVEFLDESGKVVRRMPEK